MADHVSYIPGISMTELVLYFTWHGLHICFEYEYERIVRDF